MKQTLDAKNPTTALLTRGPILDIGSYRDFVTTHDVNRDVHFRMTVPKGDIRWLPPDIQACEMAASFSSTDAGDIWLKTHSLSAENGRVLVTRQRSANGDPFALTSPLLPKNVSVGRPLKEVSELKEALQQEQPQGFMFSGAQGLRLPRRWREDEDRWRKVRPWFNAVSRLYDVQVAAVMGIEETLRGISYLGPLRSLPLRTYRMAAEPPADVGREGEYAPELLYRNREGKLLEQVENWLRELGYGRLTFEEAGDEYFQLYLEQSGGHRINIAHSGFGLSQLLPILVQGIASDRSSTFIAQQPEIHLNPAQQSVVADFLIEASQGGRRVIVETHSEHVLLRLRRRVAEGRIPASDVAIYYFDGKDGSTNVRRIPLGDHGEIARNEWPKGFFEDQLGDSFALAAAQSIARTDQP